MEKLTYIIYGAEGPAMKRAAQIKRAEGHFALIRDAARFGPRDVELADVIILLTPSRAIEEAYEGLVPVERAYANSRRAKKKTQSKVKPKPNKAKSRTR